MSEKVGLSIDDYPEDKPEFSRIVKGSLVYDWLRDTNGASKIVVREGEIRVRDSWMTMDYSVGELGEEAGDIVIYATEAEWNAYLPITEELKKEVERTLSEYEEWKKRAKRWLEGAHDIVFEAKEDGCQGKVRDGLPYQYDAFIPSKSKESLTQGDKKLMEIIREISVRETRNEYVSKVLLQGEYPPVPDEFDVEMGREYDTEFLINQIRSNYSWL